MWWPQGEVWAIKEGAASFIQCSEYYYDPQVTGINVSLRKVAATLAEVQLYPFSENFAKFLFLFCRGHTYLDNKQKALFYVYLINLMQREFNYPLEVNANFKQMPNQFTISKFLRINID